MNCLSGDLNEGFFRACGTRYRSCLFLHQRCILQVFLGIFLPGNMLTLANLSRVPISTDTLGATVICWDFFILFGPFWWAVTPYRTSRAHCSFFVRPLGWKLSLSGIPIRLESIFFWNSLIPSFARIFKY